MTSGYRWSYVASLNPMVSSPRSAKATSTGSLLPPISCHAFGALWLK